MVERLHVSMEKAFRKQVLEPLAEKHHAGNVSHCIRAALMQYDPNNQPELANELFSEDIKQVREELENLPEELAEQLDKPDAYHALHRGDSAHKQELVGLAMEIYDTMDPDKRYYASELVECIPGNHSQNNLARALSYLEEKGYVTSHSSEEPSNTKYKKV